MQNKFIQVSETMISENHAEIKTHYLIIKISNKVFSTTFGKSIDFVKSVLQKSNTKNIGFESNLYITGKFTETNNHAPIIPIPFELNIYSDMKSLDISKIFNAQDYKKMVCENCLEHLYCTNCKKYAWFNKTEEEKHENNNSTEMVK